MTEQGKIPSVVEYLQNREQELDKVVDVLVATNANSNELKSARTALIEIRHALLVAELNQPEMKEN